MYVRTWVDDRLVNINLASSRSARVLGGAEIDAFQSWLTEAHKELRVAVGNGNYTFPLLHTFPIGPYTFST